MRNINFVDNNLYHVFNRGTEKRSIFEEEFEYRRFLELVKELNTSEPIGSLYRLHKRGKSEELDSSPSEESSSSPLVEIVAYCLLPNHYHLLIKQLQDKGISRFMHKIGVGHTNYFNKKHDRSGSLFQGKYKIKEITSQNQLEYIFAYILGNSDIHKIEKFDKWKWSSFQKIEEDKIPIKGFNDKNDLLKYIKEVIKNSSKIKEDKKKLLIE